MKIIRRSPGRTAAGVFAFALALVLFATRAGAQSYDTVTIPQASLPGPILTGTTSNVLSTLDIRKQSDVAIVVKFNNSGSTNALNWTLVFRKGVDGSTWGVGDTIVWNFANQANTNTTIAATNLSGLGGYGYLQVYTVTTAGVGTLQLEEIKWAVKNPNK